jgi:hypothetical protein
MASRPVVKSAAVGEDRTRLPYIASAYPALLVACSIDWGRLSPRNSTCRRPYGRRRAGRDSPAANRTSLSRSTAQRSRSKPPQCIGDYTATVTTKRCSTNSGPRLKAWQGNLGDWPRAEPALTPNSITTWRLSARVSTRVAERVRKSSQDRKPAVQRRA